METLEKTNDYVYTATELKIKKNKTINKINQWSDIMDYRIVGNIDNYKRTNIPVGNISKNQLKKLNAYSNGLNNKMTLRKVNAYLNLLYKVLESSEKVQIRKSLKEVEIQKARKKWLKLRNEAEYSLLGYKYEKGNYYKDRIHRQKLFTL